MPTEIESKEKEILEEFREYLSNKNRKKDIVKKYRWIKENLDSIVSLAKQNDIKNIRAIDKIVKKLGILLSKKSKDELLRQKECVVSHKIAIAIIQDKIFL